MTATSSPARQARDRSETQILAQILEYLRVKQVPHWRVNVRGVPGRRATYRGMSDIIGVHPLGSRFWAIEVKKPGEHPSEDQDKFLGLVRDSGGVVTIAYSRDDVMRELGDAPTERRPQP